MRAVAGRARDRRHEAEAGEDGGEVVQAAHADHLRHTHGHDKVSLQGVRFHGLRVRGPQGAPRYTQERDVGFERERGRREGDGGVQGMPRGVERDRAVAGPGGLCVCT